MGCKTWVVVLAFSATALLPRQGLADKIPPASVPSPGADPVASLCDSIAGNLVPNCGFETGDFTDWTLSVAPPPQSGATFVFAAPSSLVNSGNFGAGLGNTLALQFLSQTLPTVPGASYTLSYWLDNPFPPDGCTPSEFQVSWNGAVISDTNPVPCITSFLQFTFGGLVATGPFTVLQFGGRQDPLFLGFDDISVTATAVPEPGAMVLVLTGLAGLAARHRRNRPGAFAARRGRIAD